VFDADTADQLKVLLAKAPRGAGHLESFSE